MLRVLFTFHQHVECGEVLVAFGFHVGRRLSFHGSLLENGPLPNQLLPCGVISYKQQSRLVVGHSGQHGAVQMARDSHKTAARRLLAISHRASLDVQLVNAEDALGEAVARRQLHELRELGVKNPVAHIFLAVVQSDLGVGRKLKIYHSYIVRLVALVLQAKLEALQTRESTQIERRLELSA